MAVCHAFGQGGDARWPFARHPASEMAVRQAPGQRDGRLPGIRPALRAAAHPALAKFLAKFLELGQSRVGGRRDYGTLAHTQPDRGIVFAEVPEEMDS